MYRRKFENQCGFIYIWRDRKRNMYYIGSHWGNVNDGYICSSNRMRDAYYRRPEDFKRRIIKTNIPDRKQTLIEEFYYLILIKKEELGRKYYNHNNHHPVHWATCEKSLLTAAEKVSRANKGKNTGPRPESTGLAISAAKKNKPLTEDHKLALKGIKKKPHTDEWKANNSIRMKKIWEKRRKTKSFKIDIPKITIEEQSKLKSTNLKNKWNDVLWKENQIEKLKEGAKNRPSRNKRYLIIFPDYTETITDNLKDFCKLNNLLLSSMYSVASGSIAHHKKFKARPIDL